MEEDWGNEEKVKGGYGFEEEKRKEDIGESRAYAVWTNGEGREPIKSEWSEEVKIDGEVEDPGSYIYEQVGGG